MTKEELEKRYDETIACLGEYIDYVYNQKSTIEANEPENKTELLSSLYRALYIICEVQLFVSIVQADTCILQKQVLFAKLGYEKRYAFSKYFSSINEAFKKLYGFPKEGEPLVKPSTKWGMLQSITPLMTDELKKEYESVTNILFANSSLATQKSNPNDGTIDFSDGWWVAVRSAESHFDAFNIYKQRHQYYSEDQLVSDTAAFRLVMDAVQKFMSDLFGHMTSLLAAYNIMLTKGKVL